MVDGIMSLASNVGNIGLRVESVSNYLLLLLLPYRWRIYSGIPYANRFAMLVFLCLLWLCFCRLVTIFSLDGRRDLKIYI